MSGAAKGVKSKAERIRDWLTANPDGGRSGQIAEALKLTTNEVSMSLADMHRREDLVRCEVAVAGKRPEFHYRLSAKAGSPRAGQPWRTMTVVGAPKPPRPEPTTRPRGKAPTPSKPVSAPATALPPVQAVAVAQAPVEEAQKSVPVPAPVEQHSSQPSRSAGEAASGAPAPAAAASPPQTFAYGFAAAGDTAAGALSALRGLERVLDPDAPPARPREEAIAQAAAEASRDWEPEPAPVPPPAMTPRFGLFSDGTLILEGLPNLPPIIAIRREHTRALVDYLRAVDQ